MRGTLVILHYKNCYRSNANHTSPSHSLIMTIPALYNSLPTIEEAHEKFFDRDTIFSKLAPLLTLYDNKFGVCLVHSHCELEEGEVMVASGNISQPERDAQCYPERWLATGEPYEFNRLPTQSPPPDLFSRFRDIVAGIDVLGLYFVGDDYPSGVLQEWTEGRTNFTKSVEKARSQDIETGWLPGTKDPITMTCYRTCERDAGGNNHYKYCHEIR